MRGRGRVRIIYSDIFRWHGVDSTFRSDSVKDDLFIREDVIRKYNIPDITSTTTSGIKMEL